MEREGLGGSRIGRWKRGEGEIWYIDGEEKDEEMRID